MQVLCSPAGALWRSHHDKDISKFLSYVLRHAPESIGLALDPQGWASVDELLEKANASGRALDLETLQRVVAQSDKKRFTFAAGGQRIRAAQGHSVAVDLGLAPSVPPDELYHGTAAATVPAILAEGIVPGRRQQVHLSATPEVARAVGQRHGKPVVLRIACARMQADGFAFTQAENGVWLTDRVPTAYLAVMEG